MGPGQRDWSFRFRSRRCWLWVEWEVELEVGEDTGRPFLGQTPSSNESDDEGANKDKERVCLYQSCYRVPSVMVPLEHGLNHHYSAVADEREHDSSSSSTWPFHLASLLCA